MSTDTSPFPALHDVALGDTRDALHAYAQVIGAWLITCRSPRKHWWQGSLRPSLRGLTTGVLHAGPGFELELNLVDSQLHARTTRGDELVEALGRQPAGVLALRVQQFLVSRGLDDRFVPETPPQHGDGGEIAGYSSECAQSVTRAWNCVTSAMEEFRAGIREETSAIQLWPHHFDLAMTWLPGDKVAGQDPDNAEYADKQMTFGFTLGDETIAEPYFYVTAYPLPGAFPTLPLPKGTRWHTTGFHGAALTYRLLSDTREPRGYLLDLWRGLLAAGRVHLPSTANE